MPSRTGTAYYFIQSVNGLNLLFYTASTFASIFHCIPRRKIWEPYTPGHCLDIARLIISSALINVVSDLAMFMIPLFCISSLQMPLKKKLGVAIVFAAGVLWVTMKCLHRLLWLDWHRIAPAWQVFCVQKQASELLVSMTKHMNWFLLPSGRQCLPCQASYISVADLFARDAEMASGIICGCMPVLPQFFRHFMPKIKSRFSTDNRSKTESASRGPLFAANPVVPWGEYDEFHNLKGKDFSIDLHSLDQTSNAPQDGIKVHAKELINLPPPPRERSGEWFESIV